MSLHFTPFLLQLVINSGGRYQKAKEVKLSFVPYLVQDLTSSYPRALHDGHLLFHWNFALFQVPGDNEKHWKPVLVVLTEKDLLIYESMPRMKEAWFSPLHTYPLLATRYLCFFIMAPSRVVGTAESARNRYSWCIAIYHTRMSWFEKQILLQ